MFTRTRRVWALLAVLGVVLRATGSGACHAVGARDPDVAASIAANATAHEAPSSAHDCADRAGGETTHGGRQPLESGSHHEPASLPQHGQDHGPQSPVDHCASLLHCTPAALAGDMVTVALVTPPSTSLPQTADARLPHFATAPDAPPPKA